MTLAAASALLAMAKDARHVIAHNRYTTNEEFSDAQAKLPRLLTLLRFDVRKALERGQAARSLIVAATLRQLDRTGSG